MLHTCAVRFDMMENLEKFWKLNKALHTYMSTHVLRFLKDAKILLSGRFFAPCQILLSPRLTGHVSPGGETWCDGRASSMRRVLVDAFRWPVQPELANGKSHMHVAEHSWSISFAFHVICRLFFL